MESNEANVLFAMGRVAEAIECAQRVLRIYEKVYILFNILYLLYVGCVLCCVVVCSLFSYFLCLFVCLFVFLFFVCLSVCLFVSLFVCLSDGGGRESLRGTRTSRHGRYVSETKPSVGTFRNGRAASDSGTANYGKEIGYLICFCYFFLGFLCGCYYYYYCFVVLFSRTPLSVPHCLFSLSRF